MIINNYYFKIWWNGKGKHEKEIIEYDNMRNANIIIIANWWAGVGSVGILIIFFYYKWIRVKRSGIYKSIYYDENKILNELLNENDHK
jgi:hypothetical protein